MHSVILTLSLWSIPHYPTLNYFEKTFQNYPFGFDIQCPIVDTLHIQNNTTTSESKPCCSSLSKSLSHLPSLRHGLNSIPNRVDSTAGQSHTHTSENTMKLRTSRNGLSLRNFRLMPSDGICIAVWVATFLTCITLALS